MRYNKCQTVTNAKLSLKRAASYDQRYRKAPLSPIGTRQLPVHCVCKGTKTAQKPFLDFINKLHKKSI